MEIKDGGIEISFNFLHFSKVLDSMGIIYV